MARQQIFSCNKCIFVIEYALTVNSVGQNKHLINAPFTVPFFIKWKICLGWLFFFASHFPGAYLVPYFILLLIIGIPLFFLELAVGQKVRRGSIGVWNYVCPSLGGIGVSSLMVRNNNNNSSKKSWLEKKQLSVCLPRVLVT